MGWDPQSARLLNESGEYEILSLKSDGLEVSEVRVGTEEGAGFWGFEEEKMVGFWYEQFKILMWEILLKPFKNYYKKEIID